MADCKNNFHVTCAQAQSYEKHVKLLFEENYKSDKLGYYGYCHLHGSIQLLENQVGLINLYIGLKYNIIFKILFLKSLVS